MRRNSGRTKSKNRTEGAKAFDIASDMEYKLLELGRLFSVTNMLAERTGDEAASDAFAHIGCTGESLVAEIKAMREQIAHLTWGYQYGQDHNPPSQDAGQDPVMRREAA